MILSREFRQPKGMKPTLVEEVNELLTEANQAIGGRLVAIAGERQGLLDGLQGMRELYHYRVFATARQLRNDAEAWFHEQEVIRPAEELFAVRYGLTVDDLDTAWSKRREGIRGVIFRKDIERRAELRDVFFGLVDMIGKEQMGDDYQYDSFIAGTTPEALSRAIQEWLDRQNWQ